MIFLDASQRHQLAVVGAVRLMYGTLPEPGSEVAALAMLRSWTFLPFREAVASFFGSLLQNSTRLLSFQLLCAACRYLPDHRQLIDELAVCVDPRTVTAEDRREGEDNRSQQEREEDEAAFQLALEAAYFVLRSSWLSQTKQMLACTSDQQTAVTNVTTAAITERTECAGEVERVLYAHGMGAYIAVMRKCKVATLSQARVLDDAALARMNVRPQDRPRLRRLWAEGSVGGIAMSRTAALSEIAVNKETNKENF